MLYELALPALLVKTLARRVLTRRGASLPAPALRLRADRGRLQRAELRMVSRVAPMLAARMALGRLERINPLHRHAIHAPQGANLLHTRAGLPFARRLGPVDGPRLLLLHGWNADSTGRRVEYGRLAPLATRARQPWLREKAWMTNEVSRHAVAWSM